MKALLIIGMQIDLIDGGPAEVSDSQSIVPVVNQLQTKFDLVTAANFQLPANHLAFAGNHPWRHPGQTIEIEGIPILLRNIFGVPGTFGAEWMPGLDTANFAFQASMGSDAQIPPHSAFFDAEKRRATGLLDFFKQNQVKELYIAGLPLEDEVKNSALDSQQAGFDTYIVRDACKGRTQEAIEDALAACEQAGVKVISSVEL